MVNSSRTAQTVCSFRTLFELDSNLDTSPCPCLLSSINWVVYVRIIGTAVTIGSISVHAFQLLVTQVLLLTTCRAVRPVPSGCPRSAWARWYASSTETRPAAAALHRCSPAGHGAKVTSGVHTWSRRDRSARLGFGQGVSRVIDAQKAYLDQQEATLFTDTGVHRLQSDRGIVCHQCAKSIFRSARGYTLTRFWPRIIWMGIYHTAPMANRARHSC